MTYRAYRYRFYPTPEQVDQLNRTFGCVRYVYNRSLRYRQDAWYERQENVSYLQSSAALTEWKKEAERAWLNEVSSVPLQQCLRHLQTAYRNFFQGRAKYPTTKKKDSGQSAEYTASAFKWNGESLRLAKQSEPLAIRWSRRFKGTPTTVTVSRDSSGRYFVSMLVDETIDTLPVVRSVVGIDVGIHSIAMTSEGRAYGNPHFTDRYAAKLAKCGITVLDEYGFTKMLHDALERTEHEAAALSGYVGTAPVPPPVWFADDPDLLPDGEDQDDPDFQDDIAPLSDLGA